MQYSAKPENMRNHIDIKLLTQWDGRDSVEAMITNFHSRSVFSENLIAIEIRKLEAQQTNQRRNVYTRCVYSYTCIEGMFV